MACAVNVCIVHVQHGYDINQLSLRVEVACELCIYSSERLLFSWHSFNQKIEAACRMRTVEVSQTDQKTTLMHAIPSFGIATLSLMSHQGQEPVLWILHACCSYLSR